MEIDMTSPRTNQVSTVGVEFSAIVTGSQVDQGLVDGSDKLNILTGDEDLDASECTGWNEPGTVSRVGTPGDFNSLGVTDGGVWLRRSPDAEIFVWIDEKGKWMRIEMTHPQCC